MIKIKQVLDHRYQALFTFNYKDPRNSMSANKTKPSVFKIIENITFIFGLQL